jgi:hypothetical protein
LHEAGDQAGLAYTERTQHADFFLYHLVHFLSP